MHRSVLSLLALALPLSAAAQGGTPAGYFRFPALHDTTLVFTAEGDLWTVGMHGGVARRLTTAPEEESRAAISPDGRTIAFTASYEGPDEVYTIPNDGGVPTRRTWDGGNSLVVGWTPKGEILFATRRYSGLPNLQLVELDPKTGARTVVPLSEASDGAVDPATGTLYFTRTPFQGSYTKRYRGGTAQSLWKFAASAPEAAPLTADYPGTSKTPMLWQGRIYFLSDRDGTMNVWSMSLAGGDLRQHTKHTEFDVQSPSLSNGRIVYQHGADLWRYDIANGTDSVIPIRLVSDFEQMREKWIKEPMKWVTTVHLSPTGDRVVLTARGQLFVAPVGAGRVVEATHQGGVRYRRGRFFPDGKSLLALSDESGEVEFWKVPANGVGSPKRITDDARVLRWDGIPSPDGRYIAHYDKDQQLWVYDSETKKDVRLAVSRNGDFADVRWSPDSRWLAFVETADNLFSQLELYDVSTHTVTPLTDDRYDSYSPAWSPDGKWIWFLSDRHFESVVPAPWGSRQPEPYFDKQTGIYAIALQRALRFPFRPADELYTAAEKSADSARATPDTASRAAKVAAKAAAASQRVRPAPPIAIDLAGIAERIHQVPIEPGDYGDLSTDGKRLYFTTRDELFATGEPETLRTLAIDDQHPRPETFMEGVTDYELSMDAKKLLVRKMDTLYVLDAGAKAPAGKELANGKVNLADWTFRLDPRDEWMQMFVEAWRLERDYFYDRGMHGLDWPAMLERYRPLAARITDRSELSDAIAQMVGELSALHTFVYGGDMRAGRDSVEPASLGALLTRDESAGGWRVQHIYRTDPDAPLARSPLAAPGTDVREGDVIVAIDGVPLKDVGDPGVLLRAKAKQQVLLSVRPKSGGDARPVVVVPITPREDANLRYDEWEYTRRLAVDSVAHDSIGYVHLRAMTRNDIAQWERDFYPVFDRQGLIIDVRHNRGGNIDSWILEKLLRKAWFYWQPRVGNPYWNMQYAFRGHVVVLCDEFTASDGEAFTEGFRRLGLGKVIGTRTWGGEIWLSSSNLLVDRGIATAAEFGVYGPESAWLIEGHGVDPDVVVDNTPHDTFMGNDAQLEAAVRELKAEIKEHPVPVPPAPKYPSKVFTSTRTDGEP